MVSLLQKSCPYVHLMVKMLYHHELDIYVHYILCILSILLFYDKTEIYDHANYGPTFGNGHDLCLLHNGTTNNQTNITGSHGYTTPKAGAAAMGNGTSAFTTTDFEVLDVSQESGSLLATAWRSIDWTEKNAIHPPICMPSLCLEAHFFVSSPPFTSSPPNPT